MSEEPSAIPNLMDTAPAMQLTRESVSHSTRYDVLNTAS
jgi:hypothetical protein